jgi:hypothetical protein
VGLRGPKGVNDKSLLFFAELFYQDFSALVEGLRLREIDREQHVEEIQKLSKLKLNYGERSQIEEDVESEIGAGRLPAVNRRETVRDLETIRFLEKNSRKWRRAARNARRSITRPAQPAILRALLAATEPEEVRAICRTAFKRVRAEIRAGVFDYVKVANWPIEDGSQFPFYLSKHAEQFLSAKKEKRFPKASNRPSSRDKQLWFFACALAGAVHDKATRTAVNLLGSRHRKKVTVPAPPYSLWERGELDFSEDLQIAIKKLEEQIDAAREIYADVIENVRQTHRF